MSSLAGYKGGSLIKRANRNQSSFHYALVGNLPALAAWFAIVCAFGGYVYATSLSQLFGLNQLLMFGYSDYLNIGFSPRTIIACAIFMFFSYGYSSYVSVYDDGLPVNVIRSVLSITIFGVLIYVFAVPYAWMRGGGEFISLSLDLFRVFIYILAVCIFFVLLRILRLKPGLYGTGFMIIIGMAVSSVAFAVMDYNKIFREVTHFNSTVYDSDIVSQNWKYLISTDKFIVFFDVEAEQSVAVRSEDIHRIRSGLPRNNERP